jgi:hypothetical protein
MNAYLESMVHVPKPDEDPCGNCVNSDEGSPVPFSDECGTCSRAGHWKSA